MRAKYMLRIDDLTPTLDLARWQPIAAILDEFELHPMLAVVPQNRDPELMLAEPWPQFWQQMRGLQSAGAAIALHGFQHMCASQRPGLLRLNRSSEFAGVDEATQREWIEQGIALLRSEGLEPRVWVAPRHGFDRTTLRILREQGIGIVSDGFARRPFGRYGMQWIPQQLWAGEEKGSGLWTMCLHPMTMNLKSIDDLRRFVAAHREDFCSLDQTLAAWSFRALGPQEKLDELLRYGRVRLRSLRSVKSSSGVAADVR